jgi:hypothetical protein
VQSSKPTASTTHDISEDCIRKNNTFFSLVGTNNPFESRLTIETTKVAIDEEACTTRESSICSSAESFSRSVSRCDSKSGDVNSANYGVGCERKRRFDELACETTSKNERQNFSKVNLIRGNRSSSRGRQYDRKASRRSKSIHRGRNERHRQQARYDYSFSDLPLEWWDRTEDCKDAKVKHTDRIDNICESREDLVMQTTLWNRNTALEPNMFPYQTPKGIEHYTLWSTRDMTHNEIVRYVDGWLRKRFPQVRRWQYDDNSGERSIELFHVHVFIEMDPYCFTPDPAQIYIPPHMLPPEEIKL